MKGLVRHRIALLEPRLYPTLVVGIFLCPAFFDKKTVLWADGTIKSHMMVEQITETPDASEKNAVSEDR